MCYEQIAFSGASIVLIIAGVASVISAIAILLGPSKSIKYGKRRGR